MTQLPVLMRRDKMFQAVLKARYLTREFRLCGVLPVHQEQRRKAEVGSYNLVQCDGTGRDTSKRKAVFLSTVTLF